MPVYVLSEITDKKTIDQIMNEDPIRKLFAEIVSIYNLPVVIYHGHNEYNISATAINGFSMQLYDNMIKIETNNREVSFSAEKLSIDNVNKAVSFLMSI